MSIAKRYHYYRKVALALFVIYSYELFFPTVALALTSGPSQPEFQHFEPATTTDMVDIFSGDFNYNIPLFELPGPNGGYPFNLAYHAGVSMDQEASWVGLGWDLNVGSMNRGLRGLPDEFNGNKGDKIFKREDSKANFTVGLNFSPNVELAGFDFIKLGTISTFYNNYKGVGFSVGFGVDVTAMLFGKGVSPVGLGLDVSMNSQEGVDIRPNINLKGENETSKFSTSFGVNFNSTYGYQGMNFDFGIKGIAKNKENGKTSPYAFSGGYNFGGFSSPAVIPNINSETRGVSFDITFKPGAELWAAFPDAEIGGYYRQEFLKDRDKEIGYKAFGYNNSQYYDGDGVMDFNREKEGNVNRYAQSLPIPHYTYDTWSIMGQGIGQMIRSYQSEVGTVYDRRATNFTTSANVSFDIGAGSGVHGSGSGGFTESVSRGNPWEENAFYNKYPNSPNVPSDKPYTYEPYYYKNHGDFTAIDYNDFSSVGGAEPLQPEILGDGSDYFLTGRYLDKKSNSVSLIDNRKTKREKRPSAVLEIKNELLQNNPESLKELYVKYYNTVGTFESSPTIDNMTALDRTTAKSHHIGGFIATNPDGLRYVYGLPAKNITQTEKTFSYKTPQNADCVNRVYKNTSSGKYYKVPITHNTLSETRLPEYPHSFLLTAIVGTDYVDVLGDGVTEDDLGYWVKFNYVKAPATFKWRVPFNGFNYSQGLASTVADDVASCTSGERENWYLQSAETKTHIARFYLSPRYDNRSATGTRDDVVSQNSFGDIATYKLDKIKLFTRFELEKQGTNAVPIKTVNFNYKDANDDEYSLCKDIDNGYNDITHARTGKLTLMSLSFTYKNNERGIENAYKFDYSAGDPELNPKYDSYNQDCWGNYKKPQGYQCSAQFPYVNQQTNSDPQITKDEKDKEASAWCLRKITLPSGAKIVVDYESDDYAFVQNKPAMQMVKIVHKDGSTTGILDGGNATYTTKITDRSTYFQLPVKIPPTTSKADADKIVQAYLDNTKLVYFKAKVCLKGDPDHKIDYEHVAGYGEVDNIEAYRSDLNDQSLPWIGQINFKATNIKGSIRTENPIQLAAWNTLQLDRPGLVHSISSSLPSSDDATKDERMAILIDMFTGVFTALKGFVMSFYGECSRGGYGAYVDLNESYIRLNSLNTRIDENGKKIQNFKYGGGHRVKGIKIVEEDGNPTSNEYGSTYDYTIMENGITTSSGVATYEPFIGGEENPLRTPLPYEVNVRLKSNYKLYTEMPFNESVYPAASVGYRKVTVHSLATDKVLKIVAAAGNNTTGALPPTTGETVYTFYTAKDFPVISTHTNIEREFTTHPLTFYLYVYAQSKDYYYGSQGFSVELNDMHGKPKGIENYAISKTGHIIDKPISATYYTYLSKPVANVNGYAANVLVNGDGGPNEGIDVEGPNGKSQKVIGVNYDIINDLRQNINRTGGGQIDVNVDAFIAGPLWLAIATAIPRISFSSSTVKTAVTNKVIYRTGLLDQVTQITDGSTVSTKTLVYDELTGQPLVQQINNGFGDHIENIVHPAYWEYAGMGAAYLNTGITFSMKFDQSQTSDQPNDKAYTVFTIDSPDEDFIVNGDELVITPFDNGSSTSGYTKIKGVVMKNHKDANGVVSIWVELSNPASISTSKMYKSFISRSGKRNQLNASAGTISKLKTQ